MSTAQDGGKFVSLTHRPPLTPGNIYIYMYKGKSIPLQASSGPEVSWKLRCVDYMSTAQVGGKVVSLTHRQPLPPGNIYMYIYRPMFVCFLPLTSAQNIEITRPAFSYFSANMTC